MTKLAIVHSAAWAYEALLLWLLACSLTGEGARVALASLYPSLGAPPPERSYAEECVASWAVVRLALIDVFTPAHLSLWWAIALVLRDARLCWAGSVLFELGEMSFKHWLPNFEECWWDRALLDVLACNGAGIWLGTRTRIAALRKKLLSEPMRTSATSAAARAAWRVDESGAQSNGGSQPPQNSSALRMHISRMLAYSPNQKSAKLIELYSVWYPATSSLSASVRSNGTRCVSASELMKNITHIGNSSGWMP